MPIMDEGVARNLAQNYARNAVQDNANIRKAYDQAMYDRQLNINAGHPEMALNVQAPQYYSENPDDWYQGVQSNMAGGSLNYDPIANMYGFNTGSTPLARASVPSIPGSGTQQYQSTMGGGSYNNPAPATTTPATTTAPKNAGATAPAGGVPPWNAPPGDAPSTKQAGATSPAGGTPPWNAPPPEPTTATPPKAVYQLPSTYTPPQPYQGATTPTYTQPTARAWSQPNPSALVQRDQGTPAPSTATAPAAFSRYANSEQRPTTANQNFDPWMASRGGGASTSRWGG